jgi:hypothetical protein
MIYRENPKFVSNELDNIRSKGLWRLYINTIIDFLDIILRMETGYSLQNVFNKEWDDGECPKGQQLETTLAFAVHMLHYWSSWLDTTFFLHAILLPLC